MWWKNSPKNSHLQNLIKKLKTKNNYLFPGVEKIFAKKTSKQHIWDVLNWRKDVSKWSYSVASEVIHLDRKSLSKSILCTYYIAQRKQALIVHQLLERWTNLLQIFCKWRRWPHERNVWNIVHCMWLLITFIFGERNILPPYTCNYSVVDVLVDKFL